MSATKNKKREVDRFIGLSLGGAKSERTSLTVIDYYLKQGKAFVVDTCESIGPEKGPGHRKEFTGDRVLLDLVKEFDVNTRVLATDAPMTLPPCFAGCKMSCAGYEKCKEPIVKWMRNQFRKTIVKNNKLKHFTPYTQRPVDVYFRYKHLGVDLFEDETLGSNKAPQAARMQYLKKFWNNYELIEVWPKLALFYIHKTLGLSLNDVASYRHIEHGVHIRDKILKNIVNQTEIFIYERDYNKFLQNVAVFDSFINCWVAMLYSTENTVKFRSDLPLDSGWVQVPELSRIS